METEPCSWMSRAYTGPAPSRRMRRTASSTSSASTSVSDLSRCTIWCTYSRTPCPVRSMVMVTSVRALDPALLRRSAAVVRDRGYIANGHHPEADRGERLDGRLAAAARALHPHVHPAETEVHRLAAAVFGRYGGRERRGLLGALEPGLARRPPRERVAPQVGDGDEQVVERGRDVGDALGLDHLLAALGARRLRWSGCGRLLLRHFLLAGDGPSRTLLGPRVGM